MKANKNIVCKLQLYKLYVLSFQAKHYEYKKEKRKKYSLFSFRVLIEL